MGDHNYNSESVSVQQDIFCSDCGKNITEKDIDYHNKYYHKVVICELCGVQNHGYLSYYAHKKKCSWKVCDSCNQQVKKQNFSRHEKKCKQPASLVDLTCESCNYKTKYRANLLRFVIFF